MKEFCATRVEHDGEYGEVFFANDMAHAKEICEKMGWFLDGELMLRVPVSEMTIEQADVFIANKNNDVDV
jgi:hypothetical protein